MENWINNKRGIVIAKDSTIPFNEEKDHGDNLRDMISNHYKQYSDYIDSINVFNGPIIIANENDITVLYTFGDQYQVYLPESLDKLNNYQCIELNSLLKRGIDNSSFAILCCPKLDDIDKPISNVSVDEILNQLTELENNIKR